MAEHLTYGFELLEERLRLLERVGFSHPEPSAIAAQPTTDHPPDEGASPTSPDALWGYESKGPFSRAVGLADRQAGSSAANAGWDDGHKAGIQECRDELAMLVEEAVGGADRRLRLIVEQIVVRFMIDAEESLEKSARMIASRAIQLVGQEIQIAAERGLRSGLEDMKASAGTSTAEIERPDTSGRTPPGRGFQRVVSREISVAADAVRQTPANLATSFGAHFHAAFQAFEEDTAKLIAVNLHKTMRDLLERELWAQRQTGGAPHPLDSADPCAPRRRPSGEILLRSNDAFCVPAPVTLGDSEPKKSSSVTDPRGVKDLHETKARPRKQTTWRILGLS